jgi:hypothetical protein
MYNDIAALPYKSDLAICVRIYTDQLRSSAGLQAGWSGGSSPDRGWEFFSSPPRRDRLWCPPSLLSSGHQRTFPGNKDIWGLKLTTHLHLMQMSRMRGAIHPLLNTSLWLGAQLKHRDTFIFTLPYWRYYRESEMRVLKEHSTVISVDAYLHKQ